MITPLDLQYEARLVVTGIVISLGAGVPLAITTGAILKAFDRQNSTMRFAVWYATLMAISLLPITGIMRLDSTASASIESSHALITIPGSWTFVGFALWGVMAAVGLLRVGIGLAKLRGLRRNCVAMDVSTLDPMLRDTLTELNSGRRTRLCISDKLRVPTAIGFFKPCVILPSWVLRELSPEQIRPLLLHELAHLRRWDDWTNLVQKLLRALFFFHPAVWWVEKRISLEREMACDDLVLAHTANPTAYADCLLSVAEKSFVRRGLSLAQGAVSRMKQTSARITQILDSRRQLVAHSWNAAPLLLVVPSILSFVVLAHSGDLVGFEDKMPASATRSASLVKVAPVQAASVQTDNPPRVAGFRMPVLRNVSAVTSIEPKRTGKEFSVARAIRKVNVTSTGPLPDQSLAFRQCGYVLRSRKAVLTQTVFVVLGAIRDGGSEDVWTVRVWQLTVYKTSAPAGESLLAKKI